MADLTVTLGVKRAGTATGPKQRKRLIMNVMAKEKQGKTHFALTAPGPIALFDFDYGLEGVIEQFEKTKEIYPIEYRINEVTVANTLPLWEKCKKDYAKALAEPRIRTIVVDTGTEMWELVRLARFGKLVQVMPNNYGPVNAEMRGLIRDTYSSDKNLVLLHKMSEIYKDNKPTGLFGMAGFKDIPYSVQINVLCWRDTDNGWHATVRDCRQNSDLAGFELEGGMVNFVSLATLVFPDTTEKEWT